MASDFIVHVIDDDDAAREALTFLLKTANYSVCPYSSAVTFLKGLAGVESGCIVSDLRMPEMSGLDLLRHLRTHSIALPVIVITGQGDASLAIEALRGGAVDFIEKPYDAETLLGAVKSAFDGHNRQASQDAERAGLLMRMASLTPPERQVLDALVAGQPTKAIAFDLHVAPRTVDLNRASIMTKMQATSLSHLVRMVMLTGS